MSGVDGGEPVYDILDCGPRHRFCTPWAVAHNCLGLGFGLGAVRFQSYAKTIAGLDLTAEESERTVNQFRASNPKIVSMWNNLGRALTVASREKDRTFEMELPSGRVIRYWDVTQTRDGMFVRRERGGDRVKMFPGKLFENCLSGDTEVLSLHRGWVRLDSLSQKDLIWDGVEFVSHQGLISRGRQSVIECHGITATPDHKFWVGDHWEPAHVACTLPIMQVSGMLPPKTRVELGRDSGNPGGRAESIEVFDILNCGPRHRFAVRGGESGPILIASNCVQATAREVFALAIQRIEQAGIPVVLHVHDEIVCEVPDDMDGASIIPGLMTTLPSWATGLPVGVEFIVSNRYEK